MEPAASRTSTSPSSIDLAGKDQDSSARLNRLPTWKPESEESANRALRSNDHAASEDGLLTINILAFTFWADSRIDILPVIDEGTSTPLVSGIAAPGIE